MGVRSRGTGNLPVEHGRVAHATSSERSCERLRAQNTRTETVRAPESTGECAKRAHPVTDREGF